MTRVREVSRIVATEEHIDALPIGAVIRCDDLEEIGMNVAERHEEGWVFIGHPEPFTSAQLAADRVAYKILWVSEGGAA